MARRAHRAVTVEPLPFEIKQLIVRELGLERSLSALRQLRATHSDFAELARPFLYAHIDFRGKSLARVQLFAQHLAPCFGRYTTSICLKPVDEEAMEHITAPRARLDHLREWDRAWSSALRHLHHINCFDLTIPTLDYESLYGGTMQEILSWSQVSGTQKTGIRDMTLRSAGYGRGGFNSATDAFNARSLALLIKAFPSLSSLRVLGVSGLDISPDGPSLRALLDLKELQVAALHLAGGWLHEFTPHFARLAPALTHLVLAEDSEIDWSAIHELLVAVPTLESFAMRQAGVVIDDSASAAINPFTSSELPCLKRVALALDGEILFSLNQFSDLRLDRLELGSNDTHFPVILSIRLASGAFPALTELGYLASAIEGDGWDRLHAACALRHIALVPGFETDKDFPPST